MNNSRIKVIEGDITDFEGDAIVNAANNSLLGGGGVDGAIHRAAGPELYDACYEIGGCPTGEARITPGFRLPARYVIHTVGPVWRGGNHDEDRLLASCYTESLKLAAENEIDSIAFPSISTGAYGFPHKKAATIAIRTVKQWLNDPKLPADITFVCFGQQMYQLYLDLLEDKN
ncbi:MAG: O-acetyl-ADP-ribose deacetylase [Lentimicrobiaceae bacterium]|jgi:O-acetyl-ADP-ribose deacetylase (regulator of RNase III)|nr:O-acetyl-ADP-ribose deacetylase [Lentimicrobiaceae bacterium]MDD4599178.1 O-acetyl-ADP-ribose deacetylase [Lentimicrobiaceae bacterium]MDY0026258.1 O-acetyl-ADP-ribose deacetylase [Lentimicrobium sp.]HAH56954.1 O-acetyl-ADP-ribose deacetylase [Bacteroidales bacterium]